MMNYSKNAEEAILGTLIRNGEVNEVIAEGIQKLKPEYFALNTTREIFDSIKKLIDTNQSFNMINLANELATSKRPIFDNESNAIAIIAEMTNNNPSDANLLGYIETAINKWKLREIDACANRTGDILHSSIDDKEKINNALKSLTGLSLESDESDFINVNDMAESFIKNLEERIQRESTLAGLSFGYDFLDNKTGGGSDGDLIAVCGKPSSGKSCLMMNIQQRALLRGDSCLFFSAEMPREVVTDRDISSLSGVDLSKIRAGRFFNGSDPSSDDHAYASIAQAAQTLLKMPYTLIDKGGLHISDIEGKARAYAVKNGAPKWIFGDYWQIIKGDGKTPLEQRADVSTRLKALAKELKCRVVLGAQLRKDARGWPDCSMIKDSAKLEEDADIILFVHSDNDLMKPTEGQQTAVIIGKCRNGECGVMATNPTMRNQRFNELNESYQKPQETNQAFKLN